MGLGGGRPRSGPLRVRIVAHDLARGGAARAADRISAALDAHRVDLGLDVSVRTVAGPAHPLGGAAAYPGGAARVRRLASSLRRRALDRLPWTPSTTELHSRADVWTGLGRELDRAPVDVLNLHWLGTGTLSIEEIGRLRHPVVLSLHDMWAFCGAEHFTYDRRFESGYATGTRPDGESGVDWNRRTWHRKARAWRQMHVVVPSRWLGDAARRSALMRDWPITVIPNPIDTEFWSPGDRAAARSVLGLPRDGRLVLFGVDGGIARHIKGADLLDAALHRLPAHLDTDTSAPVELVVYGGATAGIEAAGRLPQRVHHLGRVSDDRLLRIAYAACDVMVVPSRIDNLPNTAIEAQACGVPVVAFDVAGMPDIVEDRVTGRLATPLDVDALAEAIAWVLTDEPRRRALGSAARARAMRRFDGQRVATAYAEVYRSVDAAWTSPRRRTR